MENRMYHLFEAKRIQVHTHTQRHIHARTKSEINQYNFKMIIRIVGEDINKL